jgi:ABC-2 type transport system permease protein
MTDLIRAELLKLRTLRTFWWTIAATIAFVPVSIAQAIFAKPPSAGLGSSEGIRNVFSAGASGGVVVLLIGIAVMAGEFRHNTVTSTFLITPDRKRVIVAKLAASSLVGVALGIIASLLTLAIALPWLANRDVTLAGHGTDIAVVLLGGIAATAISALAGVGFGALVTNQTLAIAVALIWSFAVDGILVSFLPGVGRWTPGGAASALSGVATANGGLLPIWAAAALFTAYGLAFAGAGSRLIMRRDIP